ncbi:hypothetical protein [uncultured Phocaeicola sp.]|uniref:hypothetical protein n=1 Tax=uncultured Phocaeicola sp. TaxID=990718 RepID=UPI0025FADCC4|nr:hypothetical protein [uncultured Phocaeicola sp.]
MEDNKIVLDFMVSDYSDAAACTESSLIHQSQMEQMMRLFDKLYKKARKAKDSREDDFTVKHDTVSIFASRGAGKTTFLLSAQERIRKKYDKAVCLRTIDPSAIECKQHPFVNVLASIHEKVEEFLKKENLKQYAFNNNDYESQKGFNNCYKKLLKGLPVIEGVGKENIYDDWDDDEFISIKGMEKAELSNNLNVLFHEYVKKALQLMDKDCFVVAFDDIDTNFQKGYQLLEVIRKYLTTPQVITILTGDLDLYGKLVRKATWQCFDKGFLKKETEYADRAKREFAGMINQLENQYLVKILKPENRIHLKTIYENINDERSRTFNIRFSNNTEMSIDKCYEYFLDKIGFSALNPKISNSLKQYLEGLSTRIQIRLFTLINKSLTKRNDYENNFASEVMDIFWNDITQKTLNGKALLHKDRFYVVEMLNFLLNAKALRTGYNFMPSTDDPVLNKALLAIGTQFNQQVKGSPYMIFDFWLRICYLQVTIEQLGEKPDKPNIKDFLDFTKLNVNVDLTKSICLSHAYCNHEFDKNPFIVYKSLSGTAILNNFIPEYKTNEDYLLSMLPLTGSMDENMYETSFVSIYKLLAILRDILFHIEENEEDIDTLHLLLNKFVQYKFYIEPIENNYTRSQANQRKNEDYEIDTDKNASRIEKLASDILKWHYKLGNSETKFSACTPQFLSRIFTRFYFTVIGIDKDNGYKTAGEKLHAYILALLNAVMVEEAIDKNIPDLNMSTIGNIDNLFIDNIGRFHHFSIYKIEGTLFYWLAKCPLLELFLNPFIVSLLSNTEEYQFVSEKLKYSRIEMSLSLRKRQTTFYNDQLKELGEIQKWLTEYQRFKDTLEDLSILSKMLRSNKLNSDNLLEYRNERKRLQMQRDTLRKYLTENVVSLSKGKFKLSLNMTDNEFLLAASQISYLIKSLNEKIDRNKTLIKQAEKEESNIKDFVKREQKCDASPSFDYLCRIETTLQERTSNVPDFDYEFPDRL